MAHWPSSSSARQGPWWPSPGKEVRMSMPSAEAMCSPHESINSRMAPGAARPPRLETDMVQARPSPWPPLCLQDVVLFRAQSWPGCRTRPWLSLCVLSAPVPWTLLGQQSRDAAHWTGLAKREAQLTYALRLSLRSGQRPCRADPSVAPPTLADLDCSLRDLEPAPRLWETALSGLGLASVRSWTSCLSQGWGQPAWPQGRGPGAGPSP